MIRNISKTAPVLFAVCFVSLIFSGCKQTDEAANSEAISVTDVNLSGKQDCCSTTGTMSRWQAMQESVTSKETDSCCGKCQAGSETTTEEQAVAKKDDSKSSGCCSEICTACAEGKTDACRCEGGDGKTAEATQSEDPQVNTRRQDRDIFHYLLQNHEKINRTTAELDKGVKSVTESDDPEITKKLQEHVTSMHGRVKDGRPMRLWDDLYREIFKHNDKIKMEIQNTEKGVSVTQTSDDPYVAKLIKQHAKVVTGFTKRGFAEAHENHPIPSNEADNR